MKTEKLNKNIIIGILILAVLISVGLHLYEHYSEKLYNQGVADGKLLIIDAIMQSGNIPVRDNQTINWISIQQICLGN